MVPVTAHIVAPFGSPRETYPYYRLPFCQPAGGPATHIRKTFLSWLVGGDRVVDTPYHLPFRQDVERQELCTLTLNATDLELMRKAIQNDYFIKWFVDEGLPVWAFVGRTTKYIIDQPPLQQQGPQQQQGQQRAPAVQEGANSTQRPQVHAGEGRGGVAPSSSPGRRLLQTVGNADTTNEYNREYGSGTSRTSASSSSSSSGYYTTEYDGYGSSYEAVATRQQDVIVEANPGSTRLATKYDLFTHTVLQLSYNGLHVVEASVMSDPMHTVDITSAQRVNVTFTYEVKWQHRPGTTYMQRMDRYVQMANFVIYLEAHVSGLCWANGLLLVAVFLTACAQLRVRRDANRHRAVAAAAAAESAAADANADDIGGGPKQKTRLVGQGQQGKQQQLWQPLLLHRQPSGGWAGCEAQVLRAPTPYPTLLAAAVGVGTQLLCTVLLVTVVSLVQHGALEPHDTGSVLSAYVLSYVFTAAIGGFESAVQALRLNVSNGCNTSTKTVAAGQDRVLRSGWIAAVGLSTVLFAAPAFTLLVMLRLVADRYHSVAGLPWSDLGRLAALWALGACPLAALGGCMAAWGHGEAGEQDGGGGRSLPEDLSSGNAPAVIITTAEPPTGFRLCVRHGTAVLPYVALGAAATASAQWELWLVYSTAFGVKQLTQAPFLASTGFVLTAAVALCSAAMSAFDVMSYGSRRRSWRWRSFLYGLSPALCAALYCAYCYVRFDATGAVHLAVVSCYVLMACYAVFLLLGAVCCHSSHAMVTHMYGAAAGKDAGSGSWKEMWDAVRGCCTS